MRRAGVTGAGAVSGYGHGRARLAEGLAGGADAIRRLERFDVSAYVTDVAGVVPSANRPGPDPYALCVDFAVDAIREAVRDAGLDDHAAGDPRTVLVLGLSPIGGTTLVHELARDIRDRLGWTCATVTLSTACCSSTAAIGVAAALLEEGRFDRAVAGGAEAIVPGLFAGFNALGALTAGRCSPFSETLGTTLGEGAGFVVLEAEPGERARAWIQGFGLSNDAWHETSPDPSGRGLALSLAAALADAGGGSVDYVNAHGTGTAANDIAETMALRAVLGDALPPVSSTKGHLGHAQAAAGSLELIATLECAARGTIPPTLRATPPRARMPEDCVAAEAPRGGHWQRFAKNSAAFGGANASLVVGVGPGPARRPRPVWVGGLAAIGRFGAGIPALEAAWRRGVVPADAPPLPAVPRVNTEGLDPSARLAIAVTHDALIDAGLRIGRKATDAIGVVGGTIHASPTEKRRLEDGVDARGLANLPVGAFARLVMNASASAAARVLGLRGPHTAVTIGPGTGVAAVALGALLLSRDPTASHVVALGVYEPAEDAVGTGYGAAALVWSTTPTAVRLAAWALGVDGAAAQAQALERAALHRVDLVIGPADLPRLGVAPGLEGAAALVLAAHWIRMGQVRSAVVTGSGTAGAAVVLVGEER